MDIKLELSENELVLEDLFDVQQIGLIPTGTLNITENGTFDVKTYKNASVNVTSVAHLILMSEPNTTLTCDDKSHTLGENETQYPFLVSNGTHTITALKPGKTKKTESITITNLHSIAHTIYSTLVPQEYQEVEFIYNNKLAYIDTGYVIKDTPRLVTTMKKDNEGDWDNFGFSINQVPSWISDMGTGQDYYRYYTTPYQLVSTTTWNTTAWTEYDIGMVYKANGAIIASFERKSFADNTQSVLLFKARQISSGLSMKRTQLYDGDTMVRDYVPCYKVSNREAGMYDLVTNTFFASANDKKFVAGPDR